MADKIELPWKHISKIHEDAIEYMTGRMEGRYQSVKTPWRSFNEACTDGIEWGNIVTIGARPGTGKTAITNLITNNAADLNPGQNIAVLNFQFEMSSRTTGVRELSAVLGKSYKQLLSVGTKIDHHLLAKAWAHSKNQQLKEIYQVENPMTVDQMEATITEFIRGKNQGKTKDKWTSVIVTLDHSVLVKRAPGEKDVFDTLYNLGEMLTKLKKKFPIIFIILTQMNRSIEDQSRRTSGTAGNYPTTADVFGADALYMHSDILLAINRPDLYNLSSYGPEKFVVDEHLLAFHFLKTRNGNPAISFFSEEFEHMKLHEIPPPRQIPITTRSQFNKP